MSEDTEYGRVAEWKLINRGTVPAVEGVSRGGEGCSHTFRGELLSGLA